LRLKEKKIILQKDINIIENIEDIDIMLKIYALSKNTTEEFIKISNQIEKNHDEGDLNYMKLIKI